MMLLHISPYLHPGSTSQLAADLASGLQFHHTLENTVLSPSNSLVGRMVSAQVQHGIFTADKSFPTRRHKNQLLQWLDKTLPDVILAYDLRSIELAHQCLKSLPGHQQANIIGILANHSSLQGNPEALQLCHTLIVPSRHMREVLRHHCGANGERLRISVIPLGINPALCYPTYKPAEGWLEEWRRKHPYSPGTLTLCIPCRLSPSSGLEDLVTILPILHKAGIQTHVYIVGDTTTADAHYIHQLRREFKAARLTSQITWLGARGDLRDIMCACDICLSLAPRPACHHQSALEALSLGRPLAGYDHGAVGELLEAFLPEGKVKPGDAAAMADTLTQWATYRPDPYQGIPYPYRFSDTLASVAEICLTQKYPTK